MFRLALRSIAARWGRLVLTSLAIVASTAFLSGTFVFKDTIERTFNVALGQSLSLDLALSNRPSTGITASPWFWTAVGAVTLGAVVAVAFAAAPTQLAPYGGSTGVVISGASSAP